MRHKRTTLAYGVREDAGPYTLENYGGWSRNHNKASSIRRWKQPLKSKARQRNRAELHKIMKTLD